MDPGHVYMDPRQVDNVTEQVDMDNSHAGMNSKCDDMDTRHAYMDSRQEDHSRTRPQKTNFVLEGI